MSPSPVARVTVSSDLVVVDMVGLLLRTNDRPRSLYWPVDGEWWRRDVRAVSNLPTAIVWEPIELIAPVDPQTALLEYFNAKQAA
jgi:hypothetical protein